MNIKNWFEQLLAIKQKKAMPILSFPSVSLLGVSVKELIQDSTLQAEGMKAIAQRCDTLAAVSMMDLSVEAEAFGSEIKTDDNEVPTVIGRMIKSIEDVENIKIPNIGDGRTALYVEAIRKACRLITDRPVFAGMIGPFSLCGRLMDMTEIMVNCYEEPDLVHQCLSKATEFLIAYSGAYKATGAAGILMAEPAAGLLSPELIDEFSTPYVKKIVNKIQTDEFAFIYHNCGNTLPLIDSIKKIGAYAYHFGNAADMTEILSAVPDDMLVMGNIDPSSQFRNGTSESIYQTTTELLNKCGRSPNFIISSGCDIPPPAPWENIDSFFEAVSDFYSI